MWRGVSQEEAGGVTEEATSDLEPLPVKDTDAFSVKGEGKGVTVTTDEDRIGESRKYKDE